MKFSSQVQHGFYSLINRVAIVGFAFFNVLFMVRILSKEEIGVWVLYTSVTSIFEMMRAGFIKNPFISYYVSAKNEEQTSELVTSSVTLHLLLSVVTSLLFVIIAFPLSSFWNAPGLRELFHLYAIQNLLLVPYFHFEYLQTARLQFAGIFLCGVIRQGIPSVYILIHFVTGSHLSLVEIAVVQMLAVCLGTIAGYTYVHDFIKIQFRYFHKQSAKLFHFGKYTFGTNISSMFLRSTDSWMLGRLLSTGAVAIYNPALKLANIFEVPTNAVSNFIFPQVAQKMKNSGKSGVNDIYVKSVSLMLALTIPIVLPLFLFSEFFVVTIFGPAYIESADILKVTVLYSLIVPFNRQFGTIMDALQKPKLNFYTLVVMSILNVIFNFFFLKWFGIIGSAYGTLLSFLVIFIFNQFVLYKHFHISTWKVICSIFTWYSKGWYELTTGLKKVHA